MTMDRKDRLPLIGVGLIISVILMGCNPSDDALEKSRYQPLNLAEIKGKGIGDDPKAIALDLFGNKETVESEFTEEIKVIDQQAFEKIVILTQMNLPDDKIRGKRYRLEFQFDQSTGKWNLKEAGRQQSCYKSEKPKDWTIEPCP
ncbi:MAG: hypothetical protein F6J90_17020 [Moorea sp. SIOASIH]|nr:hypothetical protein [Moorena sp. SIOASIH]